MSEIFDNTAGSKPTAEEITGLSTAELAEIERRGSLSENDFRAEAEAEVARRDAMLEKFIEEELGQACGVPEGPTMGDDDERREHFETGFKKGRGRARRSLDLIEKMYAAAESAQPITGRGIGYKLFTMGAIPSMGRSDMQRVYRLLREARERGEIPWEWIVDETRELERTPSWDNPADYARTVARSYRRDFWNQQPVRCEVWSEKGTVRGVVAPVLDEYGVGFRVMHGFSGATTIYDVAQTDDSRPLVVLYIGDFDPSGMFMSERDLPERLREYGGHHIELQRIALRLHHCTHLPSFPASDKKKDPRYRWFQATFGDRCWELDAMDPNDLRSCVEAAIAKLIEPEAWQRCVVVNNAEQDSLRHILDNWVTK